MQTETRPPEASGCRLENWSCRHDPGDGCRYDAPEVLPLRLVGCVHGHPRHADGVRVVTSAVVATAGRRVETTSGSVYHLGEVDPTYRDWVASQPGLRWDDEHPVRVLRAPD